MHFIFPKNFDFKSKLLGLIDYSTIFINIIWITFIFCLTNILFKSISVKVFLCVSFCFPIFILSITGLNNENIFSVLIYLIKYFIKPKLYLYNK